MKLDMYERALARLQTTRNLLEAHGQRQRGTENVAQIAQLSGEPPAMLHGHDGWWRDVSKDTGQILAALDAQSRNESEAEGGVSPEIEWSDAT